MWKTWGEEEQRGDQKEKNPKPTGLWSAQCDSGVAEHLKFWLYQIRTYGGSHKEINLDFKINK